jgi:type II secretory pathway component PulF
MPDGARKKEYLFATDKKMLIKNIEERNCIPLKVRRVHAFFSFSKHNNNDTLITFLKNIINFSEAGYSLNKALQISVDNESNSKFKRVVIDVINTINKGCTFSSALSLHKRWFTPTIVNLIKSGENSGKLIDVLKQSKSLIEREQSLAKSVVKNIIPSLALMAAGIAILFFNAFITLPKIMNSEFFTSTMSQHTGVGIKLIYATVKITPFLAASIVLLFFVFFCVYKIKQATILRIS